MNDFIRNALVDLRARFHDQSRRQRSLYHVLVEASFASHTRFIMKAGGSLFFASSWSGVLICRSYLGENLPRLASYYFQRPGRGDGHPLAEPPEGVHEQALSRENVLGPFRELARAAGRCLTELPAGMKGLLPGIAEDPRLDSMHMVLQPPGTGPSSEWIEADYWLIMLHRLGWQAYRRRPGTLIAVRPTLWESTPTGFVPAVQDVAAREGVMWSRIEENSIFHWNERIQQDLFLSQLPFDVFLFSAYAIDAILQMDRDFSTSSNCDARPSLPESGSMTETGPTRGDAPGMDGTSIDTTGNGVASETEPGVGPSGSRTRSRDERVPGGEAEIRVRDYLKKYPGSTISKVMAGTGVSRGGVAGTSAWKAYQLAKRAKRGARAVRTRPLTDSELAVLAAKKERTTLDDLEDIRQAFLERESQEYVKQFLEMTPEEQRDFLPAYVQQLADQHEDDKRSRGR